MSRLVAVGAVPPKPWRNGHGVSRDLLAAPGGPADWSVSLADLERDAPFSAFPGADRTFTLVAGGPVRLAFGDGAVLDCPPLLPILFPGDRPLACRLETGPARALNVIVDRARFAARVAVLRLADGHGFRVAAGTVAIHCVEGRIAAGDAAVAVGEALVDEGGLATVPAFVARGGAATVACVAVA